MKKMGDKDKYNLIENNRQEQYRKERGNMTNQVLVEINIYDNGNNEDYLYWLLTKRYIEY